MKPIRRLFCIHESLSVAPSLRYSPLIRVLLRRLKKNALQFTINLISIIVAANKRQKKLVKCVNGENEEVGAR